jgi:hypothetical protein
MLRFDIGRLRFIFLVVSVSVQFAAWPGQLDCAFRTCDGRLWLRDAPVGEASRTTRVKLRACVRRCQILQHVRDCEVAAVICSQAQTTQHCRAAQRRANRPEIPTFQLLVKSAPLGKCPSDCWSGRTESPRMSAFEAFGTFICQRTPVYRRAFDGDRRRIACSRTLRRILSPPLRRSSVRPSPKHSRHYADGTAARP